MSKRVDQLIEDTQDSFDGVARDMDVLFNGQDALHEDIRQFYREFEDLRDELATNGVVRDIRKLQKDMKSVMDGLDGLRTYTQDILSDNHYGLKDTVQRLKTEITESRKRNQRNRWDLLFNSLSGGPLEAQYEPTLAGKVDAIIEHLGLDVTVKPEEVTESKVIAKKQKPAKKKGKR